MKGNLGRTPNRPIDPEVNGGGRTGVEVAAETKRSVHDAGSNLNTR